MEYRGFEVYDRTMNALKRDGLSYAYSGSWYLTEAVCMVAEERRPLMVTKEVYPIIAQANYTTAGAVERNIRSALKAAGVRKKNSEYMREVAMEVMRGDH